jgi:rare lipoprotein A
MTIVNIWHRLGILGLALTLAGSPVLAQALETQVGDATFYSNSFQGDKTASGLKFDNRKAVAAHRRFPFGTVVRVTNLDNGKTVNVTIIDRGPYGKNRREGAIIDLSRAAAAQLDMIQDGQVKVRVDVLEWGDGERRDQQSKK